MKSSLTALALAVGLAVAGAPIARAHDGAHAAEAMTVGDVKKVDASAEKITIKHGPIPHLDMTEGMTMVFKASPTLLKNVKAGDKVRFAPDKVNGELTVTKIEKVK